jgi:hypothetical protein
METSLKWLTPEEVQARVAAGDKQFALNRPGALVVLRVRGLNQGQIG